MTGEEFCTRKKQFDGKRRVPLSKTTEFFGKGVGKHLFPKKGFPTVFPVVTIPLSLKGVSSRPFLWSLTTIAGKGLARPPKKIPRDRSKNFSNLLTNREGCGKMVWKREGSFDADDRWIFQEIREGQVGCPFLGAFCRLRQAFFLKKEGTGRKEYVWQKRPP